MQPFSQWPIAVEQLLERTETLVGSGTWCWNVDTDQLFWSPQTYAIFERPITKAIDSDAAFEYYSLTHKKRLLQAVEEILNNAKPWRIDSEIKTDSGQLKWIRGTGFLHTDDNNARWVYGVLQDISHEQDEEIRLESQTGALHNVLDNLVDGVITINSRGIIEAFSRPAEMMFGYAAHEVIGRNVNMLMPEPYSSEHDQYLHNYKSTGNRKIIGIGREVQARRKSGEIFPIDLAVSENDTPTGKQFIGIIRDITVQKQNAERIEFLSFHDPLTELPNRTHLMAQLDTWLNADNIIVSCINIDFFRRINTVFGEAAGDEALITVAQRIRNMFPVDTIVAKDLGDRFVVACSQRNCTQSEVLRRLEQLLDSIRQPIALTNYESIHLSISAGLAFVHKGSMASDALLNAESALSSARRKGRDQVSIYQPKMLTQVHIDYHVESALRQEISKLRAGESCNFECWIQSKVDANYQVSSGEALIRWRMDGNIVSPAEFIPVAETLGLINEMGLWMLQQAAEVIRQSQLSISVNVSPSQFLNPDFANSVERVLSETQIPAHLLCIEITENLLLHDHEQVKEIMQYLNSWGVTFSIDDFGTGYSNLQRLQLLPVSELKIDQQFVRHMLTEHRDQTLVDSMILMARNMRLSTVAEGVETQLQADYLRDGGVDHLQGFYFAQPIPAEQWLMSNG